MRHPVAHPSPDEFHVEFLFEHISILYYKKINVFIFRHQRGYKKAVMKAEEDISKDISMYPHECLICHRPFKNKHGIKSHMSTYHSESGPKNCDTCGKQFPHNISLRNHIMSSHPELKEIECEDCKMKFFTTRELKKHSFQEHSEEGVQCNICNRRFKQKFSLEKHFMIEHKIDTINEDDVTCKICPNRKFKVKYNLKKHYMKNHNLEVSNEYPFIEFVAE